MKTNNEYPNTRNATDKALWQRINDFSPDQPGIPFPFSKKLAREQHWTHSFTAEAIAEYKKFVYLCCVLPRGASPSPIVDQVWHMHLIYTQDYWEHFCEKVLQRKLHHHPATGGRADRQKHNDWQQDTLAQYRLHFGQEPPPHIWQYRPQAPKASFSQRLWRALRMAPLLLLLLCLPGCNGAITPILIGMVSLFVFLGAANAGTSTAQDPKKKDDGGSGSSCGGSSCGSGGCGSGCGGGCGGCGGS